MKKNIFTLTNKEGKLLDKKFRKTSYYKQYLKIYILEICLYALIAGFVIGWTSAVIEDAINSTVSEIFTTSAFIVTLGFIAVSSMLFGFKRFDLLKKYYEEEEK